MSNRDTLIAQFLRSVKLQDWKFEPIASDASSRRYFRLRDGDGQSFILMDAPPQDDLGTQQFVAISQALTKKGFCAPQIVQPDYDAGILLLSDLGETTLSQVMTHDNSSELLEFTGLVAVLEKLETESIKGLSTLTPRIAGELLHVAALEYAQAPDIAAKLQKEMSALFEAYCGPATFLSLRDFHAENIIIRDTESGLDRYGLLDFQDAFYAPQGYDLVSMLRDVRKDISENTVAEIKDMYMRSVRTTSSFELQFACLSVQRNLRILGVFAKLVGQQNKKKYVEFLHRTWSHVQRDLDHQEFAKLREIFDSHFPEPTAEYLKQRGFV